MTTPERVAELLREDETLTTSSGPHSQSYSAWRTRV